jgi:hypothetical protein
LLSRHSEGVGDTIEEGKQRDDVHRLSNLVLTPTRITQLLNVSGRRTIRRFGDQLSVVQERTLGVGQTRPFEFAFQNRYNAVVRGSLNPQEVGVAVQSIRAPVQV